MHPFCTVTGKEQYPDAASARKALTRITARGHTRAKGDAGQMNAYRCKACNAFHVGHHHRGRR